MAAATPSIQETWAVFRAGRVDEAEALCRQWLRRKPLDTSALHLMANLHALRGDYFESIRLLEQSLEYKGGSARRWHDLGKSCLQVERHDEAERCFRQAIACQPDFHYAYKALARLYYASGRRPQAVEVYDEWLRLDPTNAKARHMRAAISGSDVPERCSDDCIRQQFDSFSRTFDDQLTSLGYRGPHLVAAALVRHAGDQLEALDAGCGTGLCGPEIRNKCGRLFGVDLSEKMLEQARARECYDQLFVSELCSFMQSQNQAFDAIVSADVLIYFGALEEPMSAFHRALRLDGILIFTTEALLEEDETTYRLGVKGRYSHRETYLRTLLDRNGFELLELTSETIRLELGQEVLGHLVVARKRAQC